MIKLLLEPVNLLILDEPTNHLDIRTKDILKQALLEFDGTLILVSHDRDFLDGMVSKVYEFGNKRVKEHLEGVTEFLARKKMEHLNELEKKDYVITSYSIHYTKLYDSGKQRLLRSQWRCRLYSDVNADVASKI